MAIFKCKMCGGDLDINEKMTVGTCQYCGSTMTLPKDSDDKKANLFNRANHFRRNNDFDKAMVAYENILNEDNTNAEAHWGFVLSKYGIEYVEDPKTHERVPTCHRTQYDSILIDLDYKAALDNADALAREIYVAEAKRIDDIQKQILEVSAKEEPFDVFICYKETDEAGNRTKDSVIAQDIYYHLTEEGFKVFFSRITLEDKLGSAYEPYIFAALNSSKVMVVVGTKPEHFNAIWTKNEWSRYLELIKKGRKKVLIPAYRDMDPYDLPEEFSNLQAQDMGKIGFVQDLVRGIKKVVSNGEQKPAAKEAIAMSGINPNVAPLLRRAFLFLEDSDFQNATEYFEKVLDADPENSKAYLGKLMAELKVRHQEDLADCATPFDERNNYQKALRFADDKLSSTLKGFISQIDERNESTRKDGIYSSGVAAMQGAKDERAYKFAADIFRQIPGFQDADALMEQCVYKAKMLRIEQDHKAEADRLERERRAEEERIKAEKRKRCNRRIVAIVTPIAVAIILFIVVLIIVIIPGKKYISAMKALDNKDYVTAYDTLKQLGDYKDSRGRFNEIEILGLQAKLTKTTVGDTVSFGAYEQDNNTGNGKEDIEWIVLAKENDKILVISQYALDNQKFNTSNVGVTWETCSLRKWLNETFLNAAFNSGHQAIITSVILKNSNNPIDDTEGGNDTTDRVFLLSIDEADTYFSSDSMRQLKPTAYAKAQGALENNGSCVWWLRSPGRDINTAALVDSFGFTKRYSMGYYNPNADVDGSFSVRPALWIDFSSLKE